jgi:hypothetical protein
MLQRSMANARAGDVVVLGDAPVLALGRGPYES